VSLSDSPRTFAADSGKKWGFTLGFLIFFLVRLSLNGLLKSFITFSSSSLSFAF